MQSLWAVLTTYPWLWASLFLATTGILVICLAKQHLRDKQTHPTTNSSLSPEEQDRAIILNFLVEQFDKTKRLQDNVYFRHDELDRHACSLRSAYLKIEEKSLLNHTDHRNYHLAINKSLVKLLKIIRDDAVKAIDQEGLSDHSLHEALDGSTLSAQEKSDLLDEIETFCEQLKSGAIGVEYRKKRYKQLLSMIKNVENTEERVAMKKLLLLAESADASFTHYSNLSESVFNAGSDVAALEGALDGSGQGLSAQVRAQLEALNKENMKLYSQVQMLRQWSKEHKKLAYPEGVSLSATTINDVSDEIISKHEEELKTLKTLVRNQKLTIVELESSLDEYRKLEPVKGVKPAYEQEFGALNRRLSATEDLISEQEKNVGRMRSGLDALSSQAPSGDERATLMQCIDKLKKEVVEAKEAYSTKNVEFDFISELIRVGSLEDLALLVFQYFCDQKCDPFLLITHKGRSIEMSASGSLSVKDKTIINAMMPNDASKDDERFQLQFRYQNFGGILRFLPGSTDNYDACEAMLKMAKITDAFIEKISSGQTMRGVKKQLEQCANDVKQLAQTVDVGFEHLCQTHRQLVANHVLRTQNLLRVKGASAAQIACLKQMETEMLEDMVLNGSVRIKMRKEFLTLVKKVES